MPRAPPLTQRRSTPLGDVDDCGRYGAHHDDTNRAWFCATQAVASGSVILPDKGDRADTEARARAKERYAWLDSPDHIPDHARPRQAKGGFHIIDEVKVVSPHKQFAPGAGTGNSHWGGLCAPVGHTYSFGSTEEYYRAKVFGLEGCGARGDPPLSHTTGKGWVRARKGDYTAACAKGHTVVLHLHEVYGGLHRGGVRHLRHLSRLSRTRDATAYDDPPGGLRLSYLEHWGRSLSAAAALGDAFRVVNRVRRLPELYDLPNRAPPPPPPPHRARAPPDTTAA